MSELVQDWEAEPEGKSPNSKPPNYGEPQHNKMPTEHK